MSEGMSSKHGNLAAGQPPRAVGRVARNGVINVVASLGHTFLSILTLALLARSLGRESLGIYFTVMVLSVVTQLILEAGIGTIVTLRVSQRPERWPEISAEIAGLLIIIPAASLILPLTLGSICAMLQADQRLMWLALATAVSAAAMQVEQFSFGVFRGFERFEFEAIGKLFQGCCLVLLVWLVARNATDPLKMAVCCLATSHLLAALIVLAILLRKWPMGHPLLRFTILTEWLAEGIPLGIGTILRRLTLQAGHILIALMQPAALLGVFNVALRPLGPLNLLPQALGSATFPFLARTASKQSSKLQNAFQMSIRFLLMLSLPVAGAVILLSDRIVQIIAGPNFYDAIIPMRLLGVILIFSFPSVQFRFALTSLGRQKAYASLVAITLLTEIALEAALIPSYGLLGVCWGFLIGEAFFFVAGLWVLARCGLSGFHMGPIGRTLACSLAIFLPSWGFATAGLLCQLTVLVCSTVVYLLLCVLTGAIRPEELRTLLNLATQACRATNRLARNTSP